MAETSTVSRIRTNLLANYASQIALKLLAFLWLIAVANRLGAAEYGKLVLAISITSVLGILIDFGLSVLVTREVARNRGLARTLFLRSLALKIVFSFVFSLLAILVTKLLGYPGDTAQVVHILVVFAVLLNLASIPRSIYYAYERIALSSLFSFISKASAVLVGYVLLVRGFGIFWIAGSMVLEGMVDLILGLVFFRHVLGKTVPSRSDAARFDLIRRALPFAAISVMGALLFSLDTILLSRMKGDLSVAWYNGAFRLMSAMLFLPETFAVTVYPLFCRRHQEPGGLAAWLEPSFRFLLLGGLCIATLFLFSPGVIIRLLYPADFEPAVRVLRISGAVVVPVFLNVLLGSALNAMNRETARLLAASCSVAWILGANLILIPPYGHIGAAIAALSTHLGLLIAYLFLLRRELAVLAGPGFFIRTAVALGVSGLASLAIARLVPAAALFAAPAAFAAGAVLTGAVRKADYDLALRLFRERRTTTLADGAGPT
ncbi:MAG: flippase [Candidatus Eisenbacteria bacterium]